MARAYTELAPLSWETTKREGLDLTIRVEDTRTPKCVVLSESTEENLVHAGSRRKTANRPRGRSLFGAETTREHAEGAFGRRLMAS